MDSAENQKFINFQASARYFFDTASQCFDHCVTKFDTKDLDVNEKNCVNNCFTKQMVVYGSLVNNLSQSKWRVCPLEVQCI